MLADRSLYFFDAVALPSFPMTTEYLPRKRKDLSATEDSAVLTIFIRMMKEEEECLPGTCADDKSSERMSRLR